MNIASPVDSAIMSQASKNNEVLQNVYIWSIFMGLQILQPLCHAVRFPSFSYHKLTLRKGKESWRSYMITRCQRLAPTNTTWYHKIRDNAIRAASTVKQILICVTSRRCSVKTTSCRAYTPLVVCGNESFHLQLLAAINSLHGRRNEGFILEVLGTEATGRHSMGWAEQSTSVCHPCFVGKESSAAHTPQPPAHCRCLLHRCECLWGLAWCG